LRCCARRQLLLPSASCCCLAMHRCSRKHCARWQLANRPRRGGYAPTRSAAPEPRSRCVQRRNKSRVLPLPLTPLGLGVSYLLMLLQGTTQSIRQRIEHISGSSGPAQTIARALLDGSEVVYSGGLAVRAWLAVDSCIHTIGVLNRFCVGACTSAVDWFDHSISP
jgi:hypothetical protein